MNPFCQHDLDDRTKEISNKGTSPEEVAEARRLFKNKNNRAFREVIKNLNSIAPGGSPTRGVCYYCEHDRQAAIEHIYPLSHYPRLSHSYETSILACAACNSLMKNDKFAVFREGEIFKFDTKTLDGQPTPEGDAVILNPRTDSPTDFMRIDLETGVIVPVPGLCARNQSRAEYTIRTLGLNNDALPDRRREYFDMYRGRLERLRVAIGEGDNDAVERMTSAISKAIHPSVQFEMRRQRDILGSLASVFEELPETFARAISSSD